MIFRLMRHDLKILIADRSLLVISALFTAVIAYGIINGASWTNTRGRIINDLIERGETSLSSARAEAAEYESGKPLPQTTPPALLPTGKSYPVTLPPAPLATLSVGQSDLYPYTTSVDIYAAKHAVFNFYEQDNPTNLLAGRFDLAFVLVYLFPLLILALSYNLISQEREGGTLAMTMAQAPVRLRTIVMGKVAMRLLIVLALAVGLSLIGLLFSNAPLALDGTVSRLAMWVGIVAAYASLWFAVAVLINSFGKSSATNAMALVGIWIVLVVVVPSLLNVAASTVHPVPSRLEFVSKVREADNYTRSEGQKLLAKYYGDHPELVPAGELDLSDFTRRFYAVRQENQRRLLPEMLRFEEQLERQQGLINRYRPLSPAVVMQESLNTIAGTSAERQKEFVAQVRGFMDEWQAFFVPLVFRKAMLKTADYDRVPRFKFQEESTSAVAARVGIGLLLLLAPGLLIGAFALARLRRYPLVG